MSSERWRWAPVPLALVYLLLLARQLGAVIRVGDLNADAVSAEVIGQFFGRTGPHASTVLGTFGWYATLLAELATRWLPHHRYVWEVMPYLVALGSVVLVGWSVWRIAGRWAGSVAAVLLVCTSPAMLLLLLSMTQHAPDWFCCALLGAFIVAVEQPHRRRGTLPMLALAAVVGVVVGVNAVSDPLVVLAAVLPFGLALAVSHTLVWRPESGRTLRLGAVMLVALAITWVATRALMSAWRVAPEAGLRLFQLGSAHAVGKNVGLWLQGIPILANGDFFNRNLSLGALLAVACAGLSLLAVALLPRLGWREFRTAYDRWQLQRTGTTAGSGSTPPTPAAGSGPTPPAPAAGSGTTPPAPAAGAETTPPTELPPPQLPPGHPPLARLPFVVYWSSSALALSLLFVISSYPHDVRADRYLPGVIYAAAALMPLAGVGRRWREVTVVAGTCVFALSGIASLRLRLATAQPLTPTTTLAKRVAAVAAAHHLTYGFGQYWDAAPITWTTDLRVKLYPVHTCPGGRRICPFYLHVISRWYTPQPDTRSFLLTDSAHRGLRRPAPDLGPPSAVYRIGKLRMYVYPYDIASRFDTQFEQWRPPRRHHRRLRA